MDKILFTSPSGDSCMPSSTNTHDKQQNLSNWSKIRGRDFPGRQNSQWEVEMWSYCFYS